MIGAEEKRTMQKLASPTGTFRVGPIRPPSEAASLLLQVTNGCTWNRCHFCNIYRDTKFKAYSADSVKRDIDTIAEYAHVIREYQKPDGSWELNGLNYRLMQLEDYEARQCFHMTATWLMGGGKNVFLQDGNTSALSSGRLADVLIYLKQTFPHIQRITSYGRAAEMSRHDSDYFAELKEAGLDRIHSGFETGSDKVLALINKGCTAEQEIAAGKAVKAGGIELSVYFMPGIGGKELSEENAAETAAVINAVDPDFLRIRTAAIKPGTEMYQIFFPERAREAGAKPGPTASLENSLAASLETSPAADGPHTLCSDDDKVREIRRVIELAEGISTRIVSDHMVNLLQDVKGLMCSPDEAGQVGTGQVGTDPCKAALFARIDRYLDMPETERRIYQLLRRSLRAYDLDDMEALLQGGVHGLREQVSQFTDAEWDEKMNAFICRYI